MPSLRSIAASHLTLRNAAILAGSLASVLLVAGCGVGTLDTSTAATSNVAFKGVLHGGPNPIVGATVELYATGTADPVQVSDGYGVGQELTEADAVTGTGGDTDANGSFSISKPYTCPAKQFAYIVASGGNPGSGVNNSITLVAAIGRCEDLTAGTSVYVNELTTIAAAYALGHFTTITGSQANGDLFVGIGSTDTENSQTYTSGGVSAGCVNNSFYGTTACPVTSTAGLYHAFLNAQNLMPTATYQPSAPTAVVTPGTTVNPPIPPFALMNSLGNVLVACVNSSGALQSGGVNTACGDLFDATTPPGGAAPTNTFQAMINLAANPTLAGTNDPNTSAAYTPAEFLAIASPITTVYYPALTSTPNDFSMAIYYPKCLGTNYSSPCPGTAPATNPFQGLTYPYAHATDIDDILYVANMESDSSGNTNAIAFSSNGTLLGYTPDFGTGQAAYDHAESASVDALGDIFFACGTATEVAKYTSADGVLTSDSDITSGSDKVIRGAVDRANNLWVATTSNTSTNVYEAAPGATKLTAVLTTNATGAGGGGANSASNPMGIAVDPDQNIWVTDYNSGVQGQVTIIPNGGTASAPTYNYTGSGSNQPFTVNLPTSAEGAYGVAIGGPSSTNWSVFATSETENYSGITPLTPTLSGAAVTGATPGTFVAATGDGDSELWYDAVDGDGNVFTANDAGNHLVVTPYGATANYYLQPCTSSSTTSTTCQTLNNTNRDVAIDSTGSVWLADSGDDVEVQLIGAAAPTWPQLSLGITGRP